MKITLTVTRNNISFDSMKNSMKGLLYVHIEDLLELMSHEYFIRRRFSRDYGMKRFDSQFLSLCMSDFHRKKF